MVSKRVVIQIPELNEDFRKRGFVVLPGALSEDELSFIEARTDNDLKNIHGTRNLLKNEWVRVLARRLLSRKSIRSLVGESTRVVQCSYFAKSAGRNWLVPFHRDLWVPVLEELNEPGWSKWSIKEGICYAVPPRRLLKKLVAVRLHLEENLEQNGALRVVPGSHLEEVPDGIEHLCTIPRGGALIMRPLLLHSSSKVVEGRRRVLHYLFGPHSPGSPVKWADFR